MPFSTEITNIKAEINAGLTASQYTAKDLVYVSKAIEALANAENQVSSGVIDTATINTILYVGANANDFEDTGNLTDPIAVFSKTGGASSFAQLAFRNETATSSTDIIAYMNNGDDSEGWVGMGIAGSSFDDTTYGITGPGDGYIFHNTKSGSGRNGNLVLATGDAGDENRIVIAAGGFADENNVQMTITPPRTGVRPGNVHIEATTPSTSPSTGALTVVGGVGIQGDVNIQGDITFGGTGTTLTTTTLSVSDAQVTVGSGNTTDALDLGLIGNYGVSGTAKYTGIVRDATDGVYKFFKDTTVAPSSGVVNFSGAGLSYADIKVGAIEATSATLTNITIGSVDQTEIGYLNGVTSAIQTQIDNKANLAGGATFSGTIILPSSTSIGDVDATEVGYLNGVTSNIQTQLDAKLATATASSTYAPLLQTTATPTFSSNNYTLVVGDAAKIVLASNGSTAGTVTIPSGIFSVGQVLTIVQTGSGQLTLTASGTTINSQGGKLKLNGQYASCQLICTASNTFLAIGNLVA
jgi:hypothetical protein